MVEPQREVVYEIIERSDAPAEPAAPTGPRPEGTLGPEAAEIADCAGAIAAMGGINPQSTKNDASSPWFNEFFAVQMAMGGIADPAPPALMSYTVNERLAHWKAQPQAALAARAEACASKY